MKASRVGPLPNPGSSNYGRDRARSPIKTKSCSLRAVLLEESALVRELSAFRGQKPKAHAARFQKYRNGQAVGSSCATKWCSGWGTKSELVYGTSITPSNSPLVGQVPRDLPRDRERWPISNPHLSGLRNFASQGMQKNGALAGGPSQNLFMGPPLPPQIAFWWGRSLGI